MVTTNICPSVNFLGKFLSWRGLEALRETLPVYLTFEFGVLLISYLRLAGVGLCIPEFAFSLKRGEPLSSSSQKIFTNNTHIAQKRKVLYKIKIRIRNISEIFIQFLDLWNKMQLLKSSRIRFTYSSKMYSIVVW